jgi:hypothetical protein
MALRIAKFPVIALACLIAGVVIGLVLAPVNAQQMSPIDGQIAVRSDYAVFLISGGQKRWIAPVFITDEEINAYPEGEPIFAGVAPLPAAAAAPAPPPAAAASPIAAPPAAAPAAAAPPAVPPAGSVPPPVSAAPPAAFPTPNGAVGEIDPLLPIEVDIDGKAVFEHGNQITVVIKSKTGASCELTARWPDATETAQPPQAADARGRCSYTFRVPSTVPNGLGLMRGSVREGGRASTQTVEFQIVSDL